MAKALRAAEGAPPGGAQACVVEVMVAEDLEDDVDLLTRAFNQIGGRERLRVVRDGQQAIEYLSSCGLNLPAMLLLDLKMPGLSGFEVLQWIRQDTHFRRLIVVVFSASDSASDIKRSYELGANSYVRKPTGFPELVEKVRILKAYWLELNRGL